MSLKWIGAILVIVGCGSAGAIMALHYKREIYTLRQLCSALEYMSSELEFRRTPLPELCRSTATKCSGALRSVFLFLSEELESQVSPDAHFCVKAALRRTPELPSCSAEIILALGGSLGQFGLDGQLKGLQAVRNECIRKLTELESNRIQRTRSYQTLGLCAGAALAILLF